MTGLSTTNTASVTLDVLEQMVIGKVPFPQWATLCEAGYLSGIRYPSSALVHTHSNLLSFVRGLGYRVSISGLDRLYLFRRPLSTPQLSP